MRMHEQCVYECLSLLQCAYKSAVTTITITPSKATKTIHRFICCERVCACVYAKRKKKYEQHFYKHVFIEHLLSLSSLSTLVS